VSKKKEDETPKVEKLLKSRKITLYFKVNESKLNKLHETRFKEFLKESLTKGKIQSITITGHTDSTGPASLNEKLSEQRAVHVKEILLQNTDIKTDIKLESYGSRVSSSSKESDYKHNRRVEVILGF